MTPTQIEAAASAMYSADGSRWDLASDSDRDYHRKHARLALDAARHVSEEPRVQDWHCPSWVPTDPDVPHEDRQPCAVRGEHTIHRAGLVERYRVEKIHDSEGKHDGCRYFVLDPQHDYAARAALATYAATTEHDALADALRAWGRRVNAGPV